MPTQTENRVSFHLGPIVSTPGALEALHRNNMTGLELLARHASGDWGDICEEDKELNNQALIDGSRILSAYTLPDNETKIWIITDAEIDDQHHRQCTTFLLPDEY